MIFARRGARQKGLGQDIPGLKLEEGDVLVVESKRPAQTGEIVVATVVDLGTGNGETVFRLLLAPCLVEPDKSRADLLIDDGARTAVIGPVVASFRAPKLAL